MYASVTNKKNIELSRAYLLEFLIEMREQLLVYPFLRKMFVFYPEADGILWIYCIFGSLQLKILKFNKHITSGLP